MNGVNDVAGHPGNWPTRAKADRNAPVCVTGIHLCMDGEHVVVEVEVDGRWYEVIREYGPCELPISHIVEPGGMRKAISGGSP